jgi:aspartyl-tRNA(Asn)/glutamyl-tRNA(Gln) amidotransferase subunit A
MTIVEASKGLRNKEFTSLELTKAFLERIKEKDVEIKAYITVTEDLAIEQAKIADDMIAKREGDILTGIPCAIKDNMMVKGIKCTAASKFLENYIAEYDAFVIEKLKKSGAVILGKTNLDEFAMGSSCENSAFFPTRNPHDLERVPGGSSGGSAAAVAGNLCIYALGSDTGGSIRQPASFCGITGLKPTYGAVSRYGLIAFASSLDQIGPMTKTVEDCKIVLDVIKGKDKMDSTSADFTKEVKMDKIRVGVPKEYFGKGLDSEVEKSVRETIEFLKSSGAEIVEVSLPHTDYALACYYIIAPAEASANLARFDGLRYGTYSESNDIDKVMDIYLNNRTDGFGKEVKKRIMLGTYTLSSGYYDAFYKRALKVRTLIRQDFEKALENVDVILGPTSPCLPFKIGEKSDDPMSMYLADIYTVSINLAGVPGISIPCGKSSTGLPIGLQLIGAPFEEEKLFIISSLIEKNYGHN